jgi:alpha-D-ribose 1-methylphosphonate 5-triphosphate diphosphatase
MTTPPTTEIDSRIDVVLANAMIVLSDRVVRGCLRMRDGWIEDIVCGDCDDGAAIDLHGDFLLPGLVEIHTDHLDTHLLPRAGAAWPPASAVVANDVQLIGAGITTALDAITLGDLEERHPRIEMLKECIDAVDSARSQGLLRADHWLHLRCELAHPQLPETMATQIDNPRVRLVSLMDHTPGQRQYRDLAQYRRYYARSGFVWDDAEFGALLDTRREQQRRFRELHLAIVLAYAQRRAVALASHDDSTAADVADALRAGARFSEFPTTLAAARAARVNGMHVVAGAPNLVRGGSHSGNVAAIELAQHDCLDILSSDFVPTSLLHGAFALGEIEGWSLPRAVETVTATPARALGFMDRGSLVVGKRADVIRVRRLRSHPVVVSAWVAGERRF